MMGHLSERIHTLARVVSMKHALKLLVKYLLDCYRRYVLKHLQQFRGTQIVKQFSLMPDAPINACFCRFAN